MDYKITSEPVQCILQITVYKISLSYFSLYSVSPKTYVTFFKISYVLLQRESVMHSETYHPEGS